MLAPTPNTTPSGTILQLQSEQWRVQFQWEVIETKIEGTILYDNLTQHQHQIYDHSIDMGTRGRERGLGLQCNTQIRDILGSLIYESLHECVANWAFNR